MQNELGIFRDENKFETFFGDISDKFASLFGLFYKLFSVLFLYYLRGFSGFPSYFKEIAQKENSSLLPIAENQK